MNKFLLDAKLEQDSIYITDLKLSELRLINNSDYPWLILIPRLNNMVEITDLNEEDYRLLGKEIKMISTIMQKLFKPNKLNIGVLGNVVRQLHVHIIARYENDKTFPKPVWGNDFIPYKKSELKAQISKIIASIRRAE